MKAAVSLPMMAVGEVNGFIRGSFSKVQPGVPVSPVSKKESRDNPVYRILFFFMSAMIICNEKALLIMLIAVLMFAASGLIRSASMRRKYAGIRPPDMSFYMWWCLKFLTPMQKCIQILAKKYDINPIYEYGWAVNALKKPALCSWSRVRVFFMRFQNEAL